MGKRRAGSQIATKSQESTCFRRCLKKCDMALEKLSTKAITLIQSSSRCEFGARSYERPKSRDSYPGLQLGSPGKKSHLDVALADCYRVYYMGEGGSFPRVRVVVSLVCQNARGLSQHPKVFPNANLPFCGWFWMQIRA